MEKLGNFGAGRAAVTRVPEAWKPLTRAEQGIFALECIRGQSSSVYNTSECLEISGDVAYGALKRAVEIALAENEIFSARFADSGDGPQISIRLDAVPQVNFIAIPEGYHPWEFVEKEVRKHLSSHVDLTEGALPVQNIYYTYQRGARRAYWPINMHHILMDGYSYTLLTRRVAELYNSLTSGEGCPVNWIGSRDCLYAEELQYRGSDRYSEAKDYWSSELRGAIVDNDSPKREILDAGAYSRERVSFEGRRAGHLGEIRQKYGLAEAEALLAAIAYVAHCIEGGRETFVGVTTLGRTGSRSLRAYGTSSNVLPLRVDVERGERVGAFLKKVQSKLNRLRQYQMYRIEDILKDLGLSGKNQKLYRATVNIVPFGHDVALRGCETKMHYLSGGITEELLFNVRKSNTGFYLHVDRDEERVAVKFFGERLEGVIAQFASLEEDQLLETVSVLTAREKEDFAWSEPENGVDGSLTLAKAFEEAEEEQGGAVALVDGARSYSYTEINEQANRVAWFLSDHGVRRGDRVGLVAQRGAGMVVAMLAITKCAAAYVPIDPRYPLARVVDIVDDAQPRVLIHDGEPETLEIVRGVAEQLPDLSVVDMRMPVGDASYGGRGRVAAAAAARSDDVVYVLFTSGSTGKPKGVLITHRNVLSLLRAGSEVFDTWRGEVWSVFHSYSFDMSTWEIWGSFLSRGRLVIVSRDESVDPCRFAQLVSREKVSVLTQTPTAFIQLARAAQAGDLRSLRLVVFGGEALSQSALAKSIKHLEDFDPVLANMYGITETTVHTTLKALRKSALGADQAGRGGSPVGWELPGMKIFVLDERQRPMPFGCVGEFYVAGTGVANGYLNREELNAERFLDLSRAGRKLRVYRAGDLGSRADNGELYYHGRRDNQVKIRGYRIETAEVAAVLARYPDVKDAWVVPKPSPFERQEEEIILVGYFTSSHPGIATRELHNFLTDRLPSYMVPTFLVEISEVPLTSNTKLDVRKLPEPWALRNEGKALPGDPTAQQGADIWLQAVLSNFEKVLNMPAGSVRGDDNFFELGGQSILAATLLTRLRKSAQEEGAQISIGVSDIFHNPTPLGIRSQLRFSGISPATRVLPVAEAESDPAVPKRVPLSFEQKGMWFLNKTNPKDTTYNIGFSVPLADDVDIAALGDALQMVVDRHESLRTTYMEDSQGVFQLIHPPGERKVAVPQEECGPEEAEGAVRRALAHVFDLCDDIPVAARIVAAPGQNMLVLVIHHIAIDGWSLSVFAQDLSHAYQRIRDGEQPGWEPVALQYGDYSALVNVEHRPLSLLSSTDEPPEKYWAERLRSIPAEMSAPGVAARRDANAGTRAGMLEQEIPHTLFDEVRDAARRLQVTEFSVLHAALALALHSAGFGEDVIIGTPVSARTSEEMEGMVGLVANSLPLRTKIRTDLPIADFVHEVWEADVADIRYQEYPFAKIVDVVKPPRKLNLHPVFQVMLGLQNNKLACLELGSSSYSLVPSMNAAAKFDLFFEVLPPESSALGRDEGRVRVEYNALLYDEQIVNTLLERFLEALRAIRRDLGATVGVISAGFASQFSTAPRGAGNVREEVSELFSRIGSVGEFFVRQDQGDGNPVVHAHYVPSRAGAIAEVESAIAAWSGGHNVVACAVSSMPRDGDGEVDVEALAVIAGNSAGQARLWQEEIALSPGVLRATVSREHAGAVSEPLELDMKEATRRFLRSGAQEEPLSEEGRGDALSESSGPELGGEAPDAWSDVLLRAISRNVEESIVHIDKTGAVTSSDYAELLRDATALLAGLRGMGLAVGDKIVFQLDNSKQFVAALWACVLGGFVAVPMTVVNSFSAGRAAAKKLAIVLELLDYPLVLGGHEEVGQLTGMDDLFGSDHVRMARFDEVLGRSGGEHADAQSWHCPDPDDVFLMLMTSGSTGLPKAVRLTHRNVLVRSEGAAVMNELNSDDVSFNWIPLDHVTGVVMSHLRDVYLGCRQIHAATSWVLEDILRWWDQVDRYNVTVTWAPNFAFGLVAEKAALIAGKTWDLRSVRHITNAGEMVVAEVVAKFLQALVPHGLGPDVVHPGWGMSETCSVVTDAVFRQEVYRSTGTSGSKNGFVSCGLPYPGISMRVVDENNNVLPEGKEGRFQVCGPAVTSGYFNNESANASSFTSDGWFETGDLALLRHGELYLTGRVKDVIIMNGVNYYSHEIERSVEEISGVMRSFVAAFPVRAEGATTDELAVAFVVAPGEETRTDSLHREVRDKIKQDVGVVPQYILAVSQLDIPKTEIGKIQRSALAKRLLDGNFVREIETGKRALGLVTEFPNWFYVPAWRRKAATPAAAPKTAAIFCDDSQISSGMATRIKKKLAAVGCATALIRLGDGWGRVDAEDYVVDVLDFANYGAALRAIAEHGGPVDAVVFLGGFGQSADNGAEQSLDVRQSVSLDSLFLLGKSVLANKGALPNPRLCFVGLSQQSLPEGGRASPFGSAAGAFLRSLAGESDHVAAAHVQVESDDDDAADAIVHELSSDGSDPSVSYLSGMRHVFGLRNVAQSSLDLSKSLSNEGFHVVTGGLGGVGYEVSSLLLRAGVRRLLVLGRSEPGSSQWGKAAGRLAELADRADVRYSVVDVADEVSLSSAVSEATAAWGEPPAHFWHLATSWEARPVAAHTLDSWRASLRSKVRGAVALRRISQSKSGAPITFFSSVNGVYGGAGASAYSAECAFVDALAQAIGGSTRSIAWSAWRGIGSNGTDDELALAELRGYVLLEREQALDSLAVSTFLPGNHVIVGINGASPYQNRMLVRPPSRVEKLVATVDLAPGADIKAVVRAIEESADRVRIAGLWELRNSETVAKDDPAGQARSDLEETIAVIASVWREQLEVAQIDVDKNFFDMGANSLMLARVLYLLRERIAESLSMVDLFQYPNIRSLAAHVQVRLDDAAAPRATAPRGGLAEGGAESAAPPSEGNPPQSAAVRAEKRRSGREKRLQDRRKGQ